MPFREIFGHRRLLMVLSRAVRHESLPPSLIFAGPEGVGKRHVAVAVAQALNCLQPRVADDLAGAPGDAAMAIDACGVCPACLRIGRGVHPDVAIIVPGDSGAIKVDQVRDVVDRAGYRPFEGRRRVVIIDQADTLVSSAQNALLKILEEPPASTVLLLVTSRVDVLLPTVRSRCPLLRFRALGSDDVAAALVALGQYASAADARMTAAAAGGSVGRALEVTAAELHDARKIAALVLERAATSDVKSRIETAKVLSPGSGGGAAGDREQLASHLRAMSGILRDVELLASGAEPEGLVTEDAGIDLELLSAFGGGRGLLAFAAVDRALAALERNASSKIVADWVVLQL